MRFLFFTLLLSAAGVLGAQSRNLDIYWIDTEGCAATLIVSPSGESMQENKKDSENKMF